MRKGVEGHTAEIVYLSEATHSSMRTKLRWMKEGFPTEILSVLSTVLRGSHLIHH